MIRSMNKIALIGGAAAMAVGGMAAIGYWLSAPKTGVLELAISEPSSVVQVFDQGGKLEYKHEPLKSPVAISLAGGKHKVQVAKEGFAPFSGEVEIVAGARQPLAVKLTLAHGQSNQKEKAAPDSAAPIAIDESSLEFAEIFNGRDLEGWERLGPAEAWSVDPATKMLTASGAGGLGWLLTQKEYGDFLLQLEYQLTPGSNSGVAVLADPKDRHQLEVQLANLDFFPSGAFWSNPANEKNGGYLPPQTLVREDPKGLWHRLSLEMRDHKLKVTINGVMVAQHDLEELSKLPGAYPALKRTKGRIGLQSQQNAVHFRNIKIANLDPALLKALNQPKTADMPKSAEVPSPVMGAAANRQETWRACGDYWTLKNGELSGSSLNKKLGFNTFYYSNKKYGNFELTCQAKLLRNNSGIQIRSELYDEKLAIMKGPQADMQRGYWGSLYGERLNGVMQEAPSRFEDSVVKVDQFNDMSIRCVGERVTIKINGKTSIDHEFPNLPLTGLIGFQLGHGETEVAFRNIQITELSDTLSQDRPKPPENAEMPQKAIEVPSPVAGTATLPKETWRAYGDFWSFKNGELKGSSVNKKLGFNTFYYSDKKYGNFELTCKAKLLRNNSGIQIRSELDDANLAIMRGPQADMQQGYWGSLYGERLSGVMQDAPDGFDDQVIKVDQFNDMFIRCVGKRVTIKINGKTSVDREFPEMALTGLIGFQLGHGETDVAFRDLKIVDLGDIVEMPKPPEKPRTAIEVASPLVGAPTNPPEVWGAYGDFWTLKDGELTGSSVDKKLGFNTFYYSKKSYQDFELTCQAKLLKNNSGIQIRSDLYDAKLGIMRGPQADMEKGSWGSLYGERMNGVMQKAPIRFEDETIKVNEFNDMSIRCVGQRITIKINGKTSVDREFPEIAPGGLIGFQLGHGETEAVFRNIRITELGKQP